MKALVLIAALAGATAPGGPILHPATPAGPSPEILLTDAEIAHIAVTASNIDIRAAYLAMALSTDPEIRRFAQTMITDHSAVNDQAIALVTELGVTPQDNEVSQGLMVNADAKLDEMSRLRGPEFDRAYATNEAAYHAAVADAVVNTLIPNTVNPQLKALLESAVPIFSEHLEHARSLAAEYAGS